MPKVVYTPGKGLIQQKGTGIEFSEMPFSPVQTISTSSAGGDASITKPGVYLFNAGAASTGSLPVASAFPGSMFVVRAGSAHAYALTGSNEAAGTKVFKGIQSGSLVLQDQGSKLVLSPVLGASVALLSDGKNYLVMAGSGSLSFSGT